MITDPDEIDRLLVGTTLAPLLSKWRERAANGLPAWRDFDILELRPWLGRVSLVEMLHGSQDIHWRVFGTTISERLGRDLTGCKYSERPDWVAETVFEAYWDVVRLAVPILHEIDDWDMEGRFAGLVRLMLPLTGSGTSVDFIMTAYEDAEDASAAARLSKPAGGAA